jgi:alkylation response protein AidB-like acyl-CoA dehydrogenase
MDFTLTDDHLALRDAVRRFCDGEYAAHERGVPEDATRAAQRHAGMADLGLLGLELPATHGGSELGTVEAMLVATELGRALAGAGWLAGAGLAAPLIAAAGSAAQQDRWLGAIASGTLRAALACEEPQSRWNLADLRCRARRDGDGWRLDGAKHGVLDGDAAGLLLVLAAAAEGPTLFAVAGDAAGLQRQPHRLLDGRGAAHLALAGVPAEPVGPLGSGAAFVQLALDRANAMLVAECAGAAEALLDLTLEHLRTRRQFGAPLAKFQALQHRIADQAIALEQLKSMACVAALALESDDTAARTRGVAAAKTLAAQLGRRAALDAIQLHGAMGMTEECAAARYAKRLITNGALFGDATHHRRRFGAVRRLSETQGDPA